MVGPSLEPARTLRGDVAPCLYPQTAGVANDGAGQVQVISVAAQSAVDGEVVSDGTDLEVGSDQLTTHQRATPNCTELSLQFRMSVNSGRVPSKQYTISAHPQQALAPNT